MSRPRPPRQDGPPPPPPPKDFGAFCTFVCIYINKKQTQEPKPPHNVGAKGGGLEAAAGARSPPRCVCPPCPGGCGSPPTALSMFGGGGRHCWVPKGSCSPVPAGMQDTEHPSAGLLRGGQSLTTPPRLPWAGVRFYKELAETVYFFLF